MVTAIYKRVSSKQQDTKSQSDELDAYRIQLEAKARASGSTSTSSRART